jgi:formate/nitrite transporter FocA (FNT family)
LKKATGSVPVPDQDQPEDQVKSKAELSAEEEQDVARRRAVRPHEVHEAIRREGEDELRRPSSALWWSGLAAGLSMGFSLAGEGMLRAHLPEQPWRPLISKLGYPLGFLVVILARQQLFTENTLTGVIPLLARWNRSTLLNVGRLWTVVLAANLAGATVFALVLGQTGAFDPDMRQAFLGIGEEAFSQPFGLTLLRGIFAGWLIALMVWMLPVAHHSRVAVVIVITYFVAIGRFPHIIAGSVDVLYLVATGDLAWTAYVAGYLIPTLIGNTIGGVALVSALNHAQVMAGRARG